jgi:hypothetical protein
VTILRNSSAGPVNTSGERTVTRLRNSEITTLRRQDVELGGGAHVRCLGEKDASLGAHRCVRM